jgi:hypothetical protein
VRDDTAYTAKQDSASYELFGISLFRNATSEFIPVMDGPVDPQYRLGPGDELVLILTGEVELAHTLPITREGFIVIPQVGQLSVANLTMAQLEDLLYARLSRSYSGVQRGADARAQVLGVCSDGQQYLCGHVEQQAVDHGLVLVRDVGDGRRQREDDVVILHRQQIGLAGVEPALGRTALALRAVPVTAGVVGHLVHAATTATQDMATQRRAAALLDGRHHLELTQAQVAALRGAPAGPVRAEDVGDLQGKLIWSPKNGRHEVW